MVSDDLIKKYLLQSLMKEATWIAKLDNQSVPEIIVSQGIKHMLDKILQLYYLFHPKVALQFENIFTKEALNSGLNELNENRKEWQTKYVKFWMENLMSSAIGNISDFTPEEEILDMLKHHKRIRIENEQREASANLLEKLNIPFDDDTEEETKRIGKEIQEYIDEKYGDDKK
jgi:hypothetical protein